MSHAILLIHGAWHGAWCWEENVAPWLRARGHEVHTLDLPGHGSLVGDGYRTRRVGHYVDAVQAAIDAMPSPPVVVGHSMGGFVVQHLIARRKLPGAVLVAPAPPFGVWDITLRIAMASPWPFLVANTTFDLRPLVATREQVRRVLFCEDSDDDVVEACHARLQGESWLAFVDMLLTDLPRPAMARSPVAVVGAERDHVFPPHIVQRTAEAYGVAAVMLPGGHDMMLDRSWQQTAEAIESACRGWSQR